DAWAFRQMLATGNSREEALAMSRHFAQYAEQQDAQNSNQKPNTVLGAVSQEIDNHFRTHPPAGERLQRLQSLETEPSEGRATKG
ncbi:unnamed protein product, partial [marine sediment metagenome]